MGLKQRAQAAQQAFDGLKAMGRDPTRLEFAEMLSPTEGLLDGRSMLMFGSNNYLGMTFDREVIDSAVRATRAQGVGTTGSRIANGTYADHRALEADIATFYDRRTAVVFSTGYSANLGLLSAIADEGDYLLIDGDSHASIYDACRLSRAETVRFRHNDPESLARRLARLKGTPGDKIIVVEGLYSMMGDAAPLAEIAAVRREAGENVFLVVDEAHSVGVLGARGRGLCEHAGVEADCDFIVGTFSKSVGATGGFCVSDVPGFEMIRAFSRPYMFTASISPGTVAAARTGFARLQERPDMRATLWANARRLHKGLSALGFTLGAAPSPIVAVVMAGAEQAVTLWNRLIDAGVYTNIALAPATPQGLSLLRVSVSAAHRPEQIDCALQVFAALAKDSGVARAASAA